MERSLELWRTAIFVDFDNLKLRQDRLVSPAEILDAIWTDICGKAVVQFGNLYMGMGRKEDPTPIDRGKLYQAYSRGISPIPTPGFKGNGSDVIKDLTDSSLLVDLTSTIYAHPEIGAFCIATGDKDVLPGVRKARQHGKSIRIYYRGECASVLAAEIQWLSGDGFSALVDLQTLLDSQTKSDEADRPGR